MNGNCKIHLPLDTGKSLTHNQLVCLVKEQAAGINLQKWESTLLVDTCVKLDCLSQGLSTIYQYAGYQDAVFSKLKKRYDAASDLESALRNSADTINRRIRKLAYYHAGVISSICTWRQYQWSPQPLTELLPNQNTPIMLTKSLIVDASLIMQYADMNTSSNMPWIQGANLNCISLLLAPIREASEIELLVQGSNSDNDDLFNELLSLSANEAVIENEDNMWLIIIGAIKAFIAIENKIALYWQSRTDASKETVYRIIQTCPLLRLPYVQTNSSDNMNPPSVPCVDFSWFSDELSKYNLIHNIMEKFLQILTGTSVANVDVVSPLRMKDDVMATSTEALGHSARYLSPTSTTPLPIGMKTLKSTMFAAKSHIAEQLQQEILSRTKDGQLSSENRLYVKDKREGMSPTSAISFAPFAEIVPNSSNRGFIPPKTVSSMESQQKLFTPYQEQLQYSESHHQKMITNTLPCIYSSPITAKSKSAFSMTKSGLLLEGTDKNVLHASPMMNTITIPQMNELSSSNILAASKLFVQKRDIEMQQRDMDRDQYALDRAKHISRVEKDRQRTTMLPTSIQVPGAIRPASGSNLLKKRAINGDRVTSNLTVENDTPFALQAEQLDHDDEEEEVSPYVVSPLKVNHAPTSIRTPTHSQAVSHEFTGVVRTATPDMEDDSEDVQVSPYATFLGAKHQPLTLSQVALKAHEANSRADPLNPAASFFGLSKQRSSNITDIATLALSQAKLNKSRSRSEFSDGNSDIVSACTSTTVTARKIPSVSEKSPVTFETAAPLVIHSGSNFSPVVSQARRNSKMLPKSNSGSARRNSNFRGSNVLSPIAGADEDASPTKPVHTVKMDSLPQPKPVGQPRRGSLLQKPGSAPSNLRSTVRVDARNGSSALSRSHSQKREEYLIAHPEIETHVAFGGGNRGKKVHHTNDHTYAASVHTHEDMNYLRDPTSHLMPKGFATRSLTLLGLFRSVTRSHHRAEALCESQTLHIALKGIKYDTIATNIEKLSVMKIEVWWRFIFPIFRYIRRKSRNQFVKVEILGDLLLNKVFATIGKRMLVKHQLLASGAANMITSCMRRYTQSFIPFIRRWQRMWRCYRNKHKKRFNQARRERIRIAEAARNKDPESAQNKLLQCGTFEGLIPICLPDGRKAIKTGNKKIDAIIKIQSHFRRILATIMVNNYRNAIAMIRNYIRVFRTRRCFRFLLPLIAASKVIQRTLRGWWTRRQILKRIQAGIVITKAYRRYLSRFAMRKQLHRVDRPVQIVLHGLRNVPKHMIFTDAVTVKVSVWSSQLLHIVAEKDFGSIVSNKKPNFIFISKPYPIVQQQVAVIPVAMTAAPVKTPTKRSPAVTRIVRTGRKFSGLDLLLNYRYSVRSAVVTKGADPLAQSSEVSPRDGLSNSTSPRAMPLTRGESAKHPTVMTPLEDIPEDAGNADYSLTPVGSKRIPILGGRNSNSRPNSAVGKSNSDELAGGLLSSFNNKFLRSRESSRPGSARTQSDEGDKKDQKDAQKDDQKDAQKDAQKDKESVHSVAKSSDEDLTPGPLPVIKMDGAGTGQYKGRRGVTGPLPGLSSRGLSGIPGLPGLPANGIAGLGGMGSADNSVMDSNFSAKMTRTVSTLSASQIAGLSTKRHRMSIMEVTENIKDNLTETLSEVSETITSRIRQSIVSMGFMKSSNQQSKSATMVNTNFIKVSFDELEVDIPSCHGNSVIRLEFLDGERKVGSYLYFMSLKDPDKLMFWGGENVDEVTLNQGRRNIIGAGGSLIASNALSSSGKGSFKNNAVRKQSITSTLSGIPGACPIFEYKVTAFNPMKARAQVVYLRTSGVTGFVTLAMQKHRGLITSLMRPWCKFFLSTNGTHQLYILEDRNSSIPLVTIALTSITSMMYDVDNKLTNDKDLSSVSNIKHVDISMNMNAPTCHDIVLILGGGERLHVRCDRKSRKRWQSIFETIISNTISSTDASSGVIMDTMKKLGHIFS